MNVPKISIVIPSYNKVKFIEKTLTSIFSQNYRNLEVIIQDGGSTDGTLDVIKKFSRKYSLTFESKKDGGQLDAINTGFKKASGDVLSFINADDYYSPGVFVKIAQAYEQNPDELWFAGRGHIVNEKNIEIAKIFTSYKNRLLSENKRDLLLMTNYLIQPSVFFTKVAFNKHGPFTGTKQFVMEYEFWLKLSAIKMPNVFNNYFSNFRIESTTKTKTMFNEILREDEKIVNKYTQNGFIIMLHELHNVGRKFIGWFM